MNKKDSFFDSLTEHDLESFDMLRETFKEDVNEIIFGLSEKGKEPARIIMILMYEYDLSLYTAHEMYQLALKSKEQ